MVDYLSRKRSKFKLRCCFNITMIGLNYDAVFEDGGLNYILIKGWCYFVYTCFRWLCYYYLTGCLSNSHFDYNTFSHRRLYSIPTSGNMFLSIPPRWLYMVMLFFLQLTQLLTKISTIKHFQISEMLKVKCYIADSCTERVTHFRFSSGRHMHAWCAYF